MKRLHARGVLVTGLIVAAASAAAAGTITSSIANSSIRSHIRRSPSTFSESTDLDPSKSCDVALTVAQPANDIKSYHNANYCVLKRVIEVLALQSYDSYIRNHLLHPLNIFDTNCQRDNADPWLPLYYAVGAGKAAGWTGDEAAASVIGCGAGGLQTSAASLGKYLLGMTRNTVLSQVSFDAMKSRGLGLVPNSTFLGNGYSHNGGYSNGSKQGMAAAIMYLPDDVQAALIINMQTASKDGIFPETTLVDGFNWMHSMPIGSVRLRNRATSLCMDISGNSPAPLAPLVQWGCTGSANQRFIRRWMNRGGALTGDELLEVDSSALCLDVAYGDKRASAQLIQYGCNGAPNQRFRVTPTGTGYVKVVNTNSGMCIASTSGTPGTPLTQAPCAAANASQEFSLQ